VAGLAGCGGDEHPGPREPALTTGLTEYDPALLDGPRAGALRPRYARLVVLWSAAQPRPEREPDWDAAGTGGHSPRDQLRAIRAAGRRGGGFEPIVTFFSTPPWATDGPSGCEPGRPNPNARAPADLRAYAAMVESFLAMARREGVPVRWVSPWNEPNSWLFFAPQRERCAPEAASVAPARYAQLVRAARAVLTAAPGNPELLVGETSSPYAARSGITPVSDFVAGLPFDALCAGAVWAQHQYAGDADGLAELKRALAARPCPGGRRPRIWITETGTDPPDRGRSRDTGPAACRALAGLLERFHADRRVDVAVQYTLRDDPNFPVGLVSAEGLAYPAYDLLRAWGRRSPADPPPEAPANCR
jgi:hypothetical protein